MENLLNVIVVILVIIWGIFYLGFHASAAIHILLALAAVIIAVRMIKGEKQRF